MAGRDSNGVNISTGDDDRYRYRINTPPGNVVDSLKQKILIEKDRVKDSLRKEKEKIDKQIEKLTEKAGDPTAFISHSIPGYNPMLILY